MVIETLVKTVLTELKKLSSTEMIIGEPVTVNDVTVIPVSKVSVGFGAGGGVKKTKEGEGEATGGGVSIEPVAIMVIRGDKSELITMKKEGTGFGQVIDLIPQIFEKVKTYQGTKKQKSKKRETTES